MNTNPFDWLIAAFAVWQVVEIWHHGDIFAACRERIASSWLAGPTLCPFCFSVWVGFAVGVLTAAGGWWRLPCYLFAVSRAANLFNDAAHGVTRTRRATAAGRLEAELEFRDESNDGSADGGPAPGPI